MLLVSYDEPLSTVKRFEIFLREKCVVGGFLSVQLLIEEGVNLFFAINAW